jgi:hypothetical protein
MSTAPSWLTEENISTAATVAKNPHVQAAAKDPEIQAAAKKAALNNSSPPPPPKSKAPSNSDVESGTKNVDAEFDPEELKNMQRYHLALRVGYIVSAVMMATAAVLRLLGGPDIGTAFFSIYIFLFGVLICCFEFALNVSAFK